MKHFYLICLVLFTSVSLVACSKDRLAIDLEKVDTTKTYDLSKYYLPLDDYKKAVAEHDLLFADIVSFENNTSNAIRPLFMKQTKGKQTYFTFDHAYYFPKGDVYFIANTNLPKNSGHFTPFEIAKEEETVTLSNNLNVLYRELELGQREIRYYKNNTEYILSVDIEPNGYSKDDLIELAGKILKKGD